MFAHKLKHHMFPTTLVFCEFCQLLILVGGIPTPLKNMKVSWEYYSQYMETKKCSKPPNSYNIFEFMDGFPVNGTKRVNIYIYIGIGFFSLLI